MLHVEPVILCFNHEKKCIRGHRSLDYHCILFYFLHIKQQTFQIFDFENKGRQTLNTTPCFHICSSYIPNINHMFQLHTKYQRPRYIKQKMFQPRQEIGLINLLFEPEVKGQQPWYATHRLNMFQLHTKYQRPKTRGRKGMARTGFAKKKNYDKNNMSPFSKGRHNYTNYGKLNNLSIDCLTFKTTKGC